MEKVFIRPYQILDKAIPFLRVKILHPTFQNGGSFLPGVLLKQQPVASDFRFVSAALKLISDLERIGDQCADIADMIRFTTSYDLKDFKDLEEMSGAAKDMLSNAVEAYVKKDKDLAITVIQADDKVDALFDSVKKRLIKEIGKKAEDGEFYIDIIMIAKYYERIGDHATNVAEWVYYSITGEHI